MQTNDPIAKPSPKGFTFLGAGMITLSRSVNTLTGNHVYALSTPENDWQSFGAWEDALDAITRFVTTEWAEG